MPLNSIGDQARAFALQVASNRLKTVMTTLTKEVASGEVSDLGQRLQGNTRALNEIESRIGITRQMETSGKEAGIQLQALQDMFEAVRTRTSSIGPALVGDPFAKTPIQQQTRATEMLQSLEAVVQFMNGTNSNRFLMSGQASDVKPLSDASVILDRLQTLTAGMTSADDIAQAISDWFDAPSGSGGFLDQAYHGSLGAGQRLPVGDGVMIEVTTTAASPAVRDLLKGLATGAMLERGALTGDIQETGRLMQHAGSVLTIADTSILAEMGRIGLNQQSVERAQATNASSLSTLERSRNDIRRADPYETATALTEVQSQLDAVYAVTARLSKLKLVDYLR
ncbi:flagellin [Paracoccus sp. (in: a-proteobacteria)]|uniref:flagellin n=1 Tax=Paracoccus sp. TaxID=267 RepID=UPI00396C54DF